MLLYALTIVLSAFLLFQVEPVIAKIILPWFGGSAAVWTTCLLFFQMALLLGYLYAHAVVRYLKPRMQAVLHSGLLVVSALALPIYPNASWKPVGPEDPLFKILGLLAVTVGLPYFLLSTTGPLLQAWYARTYKGAIPYRLYALSNAGSMFALLSYPVLFEPVYTTHQQAWIWSTGYGLFIALCVYTALRSGNAPVNLMETEAAAEGEDSAAPTKRDYFLWIGLAACASILLLSVTNHMSANVAAIPFLWILPLSIYLLTFILCFEGSGWYRRNPYLQLLAVALGSMAYALCQDTTGVVSIKVLVPLYSLGLFTACMVCHGELVRLKPHPRYLTHFYLMVSVGGALGGLFVGLIAPYAFNSFYEFQIGLVLCAVLVWLALRTDKSLSEWHMGWKRLLSDGSAVLIVGMAVYITMQTREATRDSIVLVRNFYGGLRVRDSGPVAALDSVRTLTHGTINHGEEYLNPARRRLPTTYYGPNTGVGVAIRDRQKIGAIRVGVVGLGTGTIAAYGRLGDYYRFYELNPLVPPIARGQFFFVTGSPAKVDIALGDARLSLEREQPENFDVLAVDAFSSDSIPVHLLTREAMALYFRHLKPDGILAVHISNRYLNLQPVLEGHSKALGKVARLVDNEDDEGQDVFGATWILLTSPNSGFDTEVKEASTELETKKQIRLWTDDYSNLFQILK